MKKVRLSIVFDVLPEDEVGIKNSVEQFLKMNFKVARIVCYRKPITFKSEVKNHEK